MIRPKKSPIPVVLRRVVPLLFAFSLALAQAQGWPAKPIRVIVPAGAGATNDILTRGLTEPLGNALGQPIIVENRVGADGIIGTEACTKASADGYSLCGTASNIIVWNTVLRKQLPYDVLRDLVPVVQAGFFDSALVVHSSLPVATFEQLLDYAKANPGKVNWGNFGVNSMGYMYLQWLNRSRGLEFYAVPYKTNTQNAQAIAVGESVVSLGSFNHFAPLLKQGKVRALGVTANKRVSFLPDVPTFEELGIKLPLRPWFGYHYPSGTPRELVARMNAEMRRVIDSPDFKSRILDRLYITPVAGAPEEFDRFVREQIAAVAKLIAYLGIKPE